MAENTTTAYGYPVKTAEELGLTEYFRKNPHVAGMAWGRGENGSDPNEPRSVVHNPFNEHMQDPVKRHGLYKIEATRHKMSENRGSVPKFAITPEMQAWREKNFQKGDPYRDDDEMFRETVISRIMVNEDVPASEEAKAIATRLDSSWFAKKDGQSTLARMAADQNRKPYNEKKISEPQPTTPMARLLDYYDKIQKNPLGTQSAMADDRSPVKRFGTDYKALADDYARATRLLRREARRGNLEAATTLPKVREAAIGAGFQTSGIRSHAGMQSDIRGAYDSYMRTGETMTAIQKAALEAAQGGAAPAAAAQPNPNPPMLQPNEDFEAGRAPLNPAATAGAGRGYAAGSKGRGGWQPFLAKPAETQPGINSSRLLKAADRNRKGLPFGSPAVFGSLPSLA